VNVGRHEVPSRTATADAVLRVITAVGLAVDAGVHADQAPLYTVVRATISQATLFTVEAAVASAAALLVLVWGRRLGFGLATLVAASALGAGLLYRFVDVGRLGPLPDMYQPVWLPGQLMSVGAEAVATLFGVAGLLVVIGRRRAVLNRRTGLPVPAEGAHPDVVR
jgi:hypothetical protein